MGSALQGAMASAQLTTDAMAGVARMVTSTLDRATQERQLQSNILEGMVRSAQNAKQMEIDSFFKGQDLELRKRQLEISNQYKGIDIGMENAKLIVDQRRVKVAEDQIRLNEKKIVEADKHKPYISTLSQRRALLGKNLDQESKKIKDDQDRLLAEINGREASGSNPAILGMSPVDRIKDELNPNGKQAQLKALQTEKTRALEDKKREFDDITNELENVTRGGDPGVYIPLPKAKTTSSINTIGDMEMGSRRTSFNAFDEPSGGDRGDGIDLSLFPTLPDSASDTAKAGLRMVNEEIAMLEGQLPQDSYQNDLSVEDEEKQKAEFTKKYDSKLLGAIYDKNTRIQDIPALISELSPISKTKIEEAKVIHESAFLSNYGRAKGFDPDKSYESESKTSEHFSEMYARSGGDPLNLSFLGAEAEIKLIDLQAEGDALSIKDDSFNVRSYVANGYKKWVSDRLIKQKEVVNNNVSSGIKTGSVIAPDGSLPGFRRIASTETKDESLDDLLGKYTVSAEDRKIKEKEDKDIELYDQFSKGFIKTEGGFDRRTFAETALQQPSLLYAVLGNERVNFEASEVGYSDAEVEAVTNANYRKLIEKTKKLNAPDAFKMWKEASKFIK